MPPQKRQENLLTPYLRRWRIPRVLPFIRRMPDCRLLDIGCGWEARFLREIAPYIAKGVGIDPAAPPLDGEPRLMTIRERLDRALPFETASFDVVSMLAVLEHLSQPEAVVAEVWRVLRPGGWFVGTVPSILGKPVLEFLAFRLLSRTPNRSGTIKILCPDFAPVPSRAKRFPGGGTPVFSVGDEQPVLRPKTPLGVMLQ